MKETENSAQKIHEKVIWLTRTAILLAMLIAAQAATAPLGSTFVTGPLVNAVLVISVLMCGAASGVSVAVISPVLAKLFGIGPLWSLIPFIMLGNAVYVLVWSAVFDKGKAWIVNSVTALATAAVCKFLVLYLGICKLAIPVLLKLPEKQAGAISAMFSLPQLFTALIGGVLALAVYSVIKIAIRNR